MFANEATKISPTQYEDKKLRHLFEGGTYNVYQEDCINLGVGAPGPDLLANCCDIFTKGTEHRMQREKRENNCYLFQYGPTTGIYEARHEIAKYLTQEYGSEVRSENLFITAGATQGLHFILSTLIDLQGFVFVDEVTYMIALDVIKQFSTLTLVPVRLTDEGVDLQDLEQAMKHHRLVSIAEHKQFAAMYYTIPVYHNPTGMVFSSSNCTGIIKLARKYNVLVCCDDVYNVLHYDAASAKPQRLFAYDKPEDTDYLGHVISNGSFSKIVGPGVRLGWLEVPPRLKRVLEKSGVANSGGCFQNYTSGIVASLFQLGLAQSHIAHMREVYGGRMKAMCETLRARLPEGCLMESPKGGYFIWIRLPATVAAADFLDYCLKAERRLFFLNGNIFSLSGGSRNCVRVAIPFHSEAKLREAASLFCSLLVEFTTKQ